MEPITLLNDKRIVLGVTGSIAVYKAIDLASKLTQAGAMVDALTGVFGLAGDEALVTLPECLPRGDRIRIGHT